MLLQARPLFHCRSESRISHIAHPYSIAAVLCVKIPRYMPGLVYKLFSFVSRKNYCWIYSENGATGDLDANISWVLIHLIMARSPPGFKTFLITVRSIAGWLQLLLALTSWLGPCGCSAFQANPYLFLLSAALLASQDVVRNKSQSEADFIIDRQVNFACRP